MTVDFARLRNSLSITIEMALHQKSSTSVGNAPPTVRVTISSPEYALLDTGCALDYVDLAEYDFDATFRNSRAIIQSSAQQLQALGQTLSRLQEVPLDTRPSGLPAVVVIFTDAVKKLGTFATGVARHVDTAESALRRLNEDHESDVRTKIEHLSKVLTDLLAEHSVCGNVEEKNDRLFQELRMVRMLNEGLKTENKELTAEIGRIRDNRYLPAGQQFPPHPPGTRFSRMWRALLKLKPRNAGQKATFESGLFQAENRDHQGAMFRRSAHMLRSLVISD
jgi:hypothetical protein